MNIISSPSAHPHRGFTLLEVLLALSLATVLILGIFSVMRLQTRFTHDGAGRVDEAQLARSILQLIATDIRNSSVNLGITGDEQRLVVSWRRITADTWQHSEIQDQEMASEFKARDENAAIPIQNSLSRADAVQEYATEPPTFDRFAYLLIEDDAEESPNEPAVEPVSTLPTVRNWQAGSLPHAQHSTLDDPLAVFLGESPGEPPPHGLVRVELDRLSQIGESPRPLARAAAATESPVTITEPHPIRAIAPEVRYLRFQYLGEYGWTSSWGGTAGPPRAVEIEFGLADGETTARQASSRSTPNERDVSEPETVAGDEMGQSPSDLDLHFYRLVVRVPAGPAVGPASVMTEPLEYVRRSADDELPPGAAIPKLQFQPARRQGVRP